MPASQNVIDHVIRLIVLLYCIDLVSDVIVTNDPLCDGVNSNASFIEAHVLQQRLSLLIDASLSLTFEISDAGCPHTLCPFTSLWSDR